MADGTNIGNCGGQWMTDSAKSLSGFTSLSASESSSFTSTTYGNHLFAFNTDGGQIYQAYDGASPEYSTGATASPNSPMAASWNHPANSQVSIVSHDSSRDSAILAVD